jgi:hypothetical protein
MREKAFMYSASVLIFKYVFVWALPPDCRLLKTRLRFNKRLRGIEFRASGR